MKQDGIKITWFQGETEYAHTILAAEQQIAQEIYCAAVNAARAKQQEQETEIKEI